MLCKVSANDISRYICNIYTPWTRTCSAIYRQTTGPALWFSLPCILCRYSVVIITYQIYSTWLTINHIDYLWFGQFSQWVTVSCYILMRCWQHAVVRDTVYTITYPHGFRMVCFVAVIWYFLTDWNYSYFHILHGFVTGTKVLPLTRGTNPKWCR